MKGGITRFILVVIVVILAIWAYNTWFKRTGTVELFVPYENARILLDNRTRDIETIDNIATITGVGTGPHLLLISRDGAWPWTKRVIIREGETVQTSVLLAPRIPSGFIITQADSEYYALLNLIDKNKTPTLNSPLLSPSGNLSVWVGGNRVMAKWLGDEKNIPYYFCINQCLEVIEVHNSLSTINNLSFYPDFDDILIISSKSQIFALEINKEGTQNFQPVYSGQDPRFFISDNKEFYVRDGNSLELINI